jgi:hypothetical protein
MAAVEIAAVDENVAALPELADIFGGQIVKCYLALPG